MFKKMILFLAFLIGTNTLEIQAAQEPLTVAGHLAYGACTLGFAALSLKDYSNSKQAIPLLHNRTYSGPTIGIIFDANAESKVVAENTHLRFKVNENDDPEAHIFVNVNNQRIPFNQARKYHYDQSGVTVTGSTKYLTITGSTNALEHVSIESTSPKRKKAFLKAIAYATVSTALGAAWLYAATCK